MKDSGIPWIGEIPKDWRTNRAKTIFVQSTTKGNERLVLQSATQDRGVVDKDTLEGVVQVAADADLRTFKTVHIDDFVISLRSFQGGFEICHNEGVISPAYTVFRLRKKSYTGYYRLLFKSYGFIDKINSLTVGIREGKNIQYKDFADMEIPIPPDVEQQRIAEFLDRKCGEIDETIALQEEFIEELKAYKQSVISEAITRGLNPNVKFKDCGIDWIGEIPQGWVTKKLKFSCQLYGRIGFRGYTADDLVPEGEGAITLSPTNMDGIMLDFSKCTYLKWDKYYESPEIMVKNGDVLLVKTASVGKCSYVEGLPMETTVNPQILVLKQHKDIAKYIAYIFQTPLGTYYIDTTKGGSTIYTISQEKIGNYEFPFPTLSEQQFIVEYLDNKCTEIDNLISIKRQKIEELKDYKKSVIYEYVTGKKEVNG